MRGKESVTFLEENGRMRSQQFFSATFALGLFFAGEEELRISAPGPSRRQSAGRLLRQSCSRSSRRGPGLPRQGRGAE